jgi:oligosaccharide repeat unit polymerase
MNISTDILLCLTYLILWIVAFAWYHVKRFVLDSGTVIIGMQVIYAVFSILTLTDPLFSAAYEELALFPYIYLFSMLMIAMLPIIMNHIDSPKTIAEPNTRIMHIVSIILAVTAVLQIPDVLSEGSGGIMKLITDVDAGKEAYEETAESMSEAGGSISNVPAVIFNMLTDFIPFFLFYFLTKKSKNYWVIIGLFIALLMSVVLPVSRGQRAGTVQGILTIIATFFMFRMYMPALTRKIIMSLGVSVVLLVSIPVIAITYSRFGEKAAGATGFVTWYVGQGSLYFNNFGLDAGGTRNGDRTINLVKRVIDPSTPQNYVERRDKYPNLKIDDYFFVTFVGDFVIDFGPIIATIIIIVFSIVAWRGTRSRDGTITIYQLLLLHFVLCVNIQGGMTLFSYSDTGNLRIFAYLMLYIYMRYHDRLLEKFEKVD